MRRIFEQPCAFQTFLFSWSNTKEEKRLHIEFCADYFVIFDFCKRALCKKLVRGWSFSYNFVSELINLTSPKCFILPWNAAFSLYSLTWGCCRPQGFGSRARGRCPFSLGGLEQHVRFHFFSGGSYGLVTFTRRRAYVFRHGYCFESGTGR